MVAPDQENTSPDSGLPSLCGIAAYFRIAASLAQIRRERALSENASISPEDIVRAAQLIGLKARIVSTLTNERLAALPAPDTALHEVRRLRSLRR
jgi:ATP-binding cassette, subfamily B, bacterial HlyB/CyaB